MKAYYLIEAYEMAKLAKPILHGPFTGFPDLQYEQKAQEIRRRQDRDCDVLWAIKMEDGALSLVAVPGDDCEDCNVCDKTVNCADPYFATACGTYCETCMEEHMRECEECTREFK